LTAKISHVKTAKALHHYFGGMPQLKIARKCGVNQAAVSRCAAKFQKAAAQGMVEATKEYGIVRFAIVSLASWLFLAGAGSTQGLSLSWPTKFTGHIVGKIWPIYYGKPLDNYSR